MTFPDTAGGIVLDVAALVTVADDLIQRREGLGSRLYSHAREAGLTLAVPPVVLGKAMTLYLDGRGQTLLGAFLAPGVFRQPDDPLRAAGERGLWRLVPYRPDELAAYSELLGQAGDPVVAYVAAYAGETGWPVATSDPATYAKLLGRDDAIVMPPLPA